MENYLLVDHKRGYKTKVNNVLSLLTHKKFNADVHFIKLKNISRDNTKMKDVLKHVFKLFQKKIIFLKLF